MDRKVGFIGAGNIVRAILAGVSKSGKYPKDQIGVFDVSQQVLDGLKKQGYATYPSIGELASQSQIVVVAVTPQVIGSIIGEIRASLSEDAVVLSVVAGITNAWYQEHLGASCKVVRCMPTLTAQVGIGSFAVSCTDTVTEQDERAVRDFLESCGIVEEIPETLMTEVVPFNGSAPGYFYHMTRVIVEEAVRLGFERDAALRLFAQTMKGSAETLLSSGMSVEELEGKLRLPGGTTVAALDKMEALGMDACLAEGVRACVERCRELGNA